MIKHAEKFVALSAIVLILGLTSCGKSKSNDIEIALTPAEPIIMTADKKLGDEDIKAPWFFHSVKVKNNSDETVTIVALRYEVVSTKDGITKTTESSTSGIDDDDVLYLAQVEPGQENTTLFAKYYVGSLAAADSLNYRVTAKFIGWFGTFDEPSERFEKSVRFKTQ